MAGVAVVGMALAPPASAATFVTVYQNAFTPVTVAGASPPVYVTVQAAATDNTRELATYTCQVYAPGAINTSMRCGQNGVGGDIYNGNTGPYSEVFAITGTARADICFTVELLYAPDNQRAVISGVCTGTTQLPAG